MNFLGIGTFFTIIITLIFIITFMLKNIFNLNKKQTFFYFLLFLSFVLSIFGGVFLTYNNQFFIADFIYHFGTFGSGALFLSSLIIIPTFFIKLIYRKKFHNYFKYFIIFCIFSINIFGIFNGFSTTVKKYSIKTEKNTVLKGKKIILIADTHYGKIFNLRSAEKLVEKINSIEAEMVLIAGDLFDGPKIDFFEIGKILQKINKPIFLALGNHEEYGNTQEMIKAIEENKLFLVNQSGYNFQGTNIVGVSYHENKQKENFENNLKNISINPENFNILIKHEPTFIETAHKNNYDLVVSGHTHNGQMWPINFIAKKLYGKYIYGLNEENGKYNITTSGVGSWGPPQRLGSRSEIVLINFE